MKKIFLLCLMFNCIKADGETSNHQIQQNNQIPQQAQRAHVMHVSHHELVKIIPENTPMIITNIRFNVFQNTTNPVLFDPRTIYFLSELECSVNSQETIQDDMIFRYDDPEMQRLISDLPELISNRAILADPSAFLATPPLQAYPDHRLRSRCGICPIDHKHPFLNIVEITKPTLNIEVIHRYVMAKIFEQPENYANVMQIIKENLASDAEPNFNSIMREIVDNRESFPEIEIFVQNNPDILNGNYNNIIMQEIFATPQNHPNIMKLIKTRINYSSIMEQMVQIQEVKNELHPYPDNEDIRIRTRTMAIMAFDEHVNVLNLINQYSRAYKFIENNFFLMARMYDFIDRLEASNELLR